MKITQETVKAIIILRELKEEFNKLEKEIDRMFFEHFKKPLEEYTPEDWEEYDKISNSNPKIKKLIRRKLSLDKLINDLYKKIAQDMEIKPVDIIIHWDKFLKILDKYKTK